MSSYTHQIFFLDGQWGQTSDWGRPPLEPPWYINKKNPHKKSLISRLRGTITDTSNHSRWATLPLDSSWNARHCSTRRVETFKTVSIKR